MNCLFCSQPIDEHELSLQAEKFQASPMHKECFDTFSSVDEYMEYVKEGFIKYMLKGEKK